MSLATRLLGANPGVQVSNALSGSLTTPGAKQAFIPITAYQSISSTVLGSTTQTVTFSNIPQTFKHLEVRAYHWLNANGNNWDSSAYWAANSDTDQNNYHRMGATSFNTGNPSLTGNTASRVMIARTGGNENGTYYPGMSIIRFLDYSATTKYKSAIIHNGIDNSGTGGYNFVDACTWMNTSALTSLDFTPTGTDNWATGTTFSLYGILGN